MNKKIKHYNDYGNYLCNNVTKTTDYKMTEIEADVTCQHCIRINKRNKAFDILVMSGKK